MAIEKGMEATDKLPYEFEIPPHLWRKLDIDPNTPRDAKFYATLMRDGDIEVRGHQGFHVPRLNHFALAFYAYLKGQQDLPPGLEQIQTHPRIRRLIEDAHGHLVYSSRIERFSSLGSSGLPRGGGH